MNVAGVAIAYEATLPFPVCAVEHDPGIDRPTDEFVGSAYTEDNEGRRKDGVDNGSDKKPVTRPCTRITPYIALGKFASADM